MDVQAGALDGALRPTVLYRDDQLLVVSKPAGLVVHRNRFDRSEPTCIDLLAETIGASVFGVHRLDRATAGVMIFALNPEAASAMSLQFRERTVRKEYVALVRGHIREPGVVESPIRKELTGPEVDAVTVYRPIARTELPFAVGPNPTAWYTLVQLELHTGRTHQARHHMHRINHPIVGDKRHGDQHQNRFFRDQFGLERLFLFARYIRLRHPATGRIVSAVAALPEWWTTTLRRIGTGIPEALAAGDRVNIE